MTLAYSGAALLKPKTPVADVLPQQQSAKHLVGKTFAEQEQALTPKTPDPISKEPTPLDAKDATLVEDANAPMQGPGGEADKMRSAIGRATEQFKSEKHEFQETYLEKHERHQKNKGLKPGDEGHHKSPERERREDNAKAKPYIKERAREKAEAEVPEAGSRLERLVGKDKQHEAYKLHKRHDYMMHRQYAGGSAETEKYRASIETEKADLKIEKDNAALLARLKEQAATDPNLDVKAAYKAQRTLTSKKQAERDAPITLLQRMDPLKNDDVKAKAEAFAQSEKDKATAKEAAKKADKAAIDKNKALVEAGVLTEEQAFVRMKAQGISDEKLRKKWNKKVKGASERAQYRDLKVHSTARGPSAKSGTAIKSVTSNMAYANTTAGIGNKLGTQGAKLAGDTVATGSKVTTDSGSVTMGGTSNQAGGIIGGVAAVTNAISATDKIITALGQREDEDGATREKAKTDIVNGTIKLGTSATSGTASILKAVQAFTNDPAVALAMRADGIPIVGVIAASIKLIAACAELAAGAERVHKGGKIRDEAKAGGKTAIAAALKGTRNADIQIVASASVDVVTSLASLVGNSLTLGGVTGPAGAALTGLAGGVSAVKSIATIVYASVEAREAKKQQVKYANATKEGSGASEEEIVRRGKKLITSNISYAIQILIDAARAGDPQALDFLRMFALDTKDFATMKDESIRAAILTTVDKSDEPETLLDKVKGAPQKLRGAKNTIGRTLGTRDY